jgi:hypothetical protein
MKCSLAFPSGSQWPEDDRPPSLPYFEGLWGEAAESYAAEFMGKRAVGKPTPRGIQKFLNSSIELKLSELGWSGVDGRFHKGLEWMRVSFRHYTTIGSDILDAARMARVEGFERVTLIAASSDFMSIISPADAKSLCTSEGYRIQTTLNDFIIDFPMAIGTLEPTSTLDEQVASIVRGAR